VLISLTLITFITSGCSSVKKLEIFSKPVERAPLGLADPLPPKLVGMRWVVITEANQQDVFARLEKNRQDGALFGLTDDGYETLSLNLAHIRKYVSKIRATLRHYREYYEPVKPQEKVK
jgi:hypothetical protein